MPNASGLKRSAWGRTIILVRKQLRPRSDGPILGDQIRVESSSPEELRLLQLSCALPFGVLGAAQVVVGVGQGLVGGAKFGRRVVAISRVDDGGFVVSGFDEGGADGVVGLGGIGLKFDGFVQVPGGFGVLSFLRQRDAQTVLREIEVGVGGGDRGEGSDGAVGFEAVPPKQGLDGAPLHDFEYFVCGGDFILGVDAGCGGGCPGGLLESYVA